MTLEELKQYLKQKRGEHSDFFECATGLDYRMFDTVCAFLNTKGGLIVLGVKTNGEITGIDPLNIEKYKKEIIRASNNASYINPPFILHPEDFVIHGKSVIAIWVPISSQVHKYSNIIFDRVHDTNTKVAGQHIDEIYSRKRNFFTENIIYPFLNKDHFNPELFNKSRNLIRSHNPDHPWLALNDDELLITAGFKTTDFMTGKRGFTLAAALLFGKDIVIQQILPQYRLDAMVRIVNTDRYDDRLIIQTNLIEAYEKLMGFIGKHLNDRFYMEGDIRISLRERIFREVVANLIVHREYTNAHTATFIIYEDRVEIKNANNPRDFRRLKVGSFEPFQKNPNIARYFRALGRSEEIGSGIRNVNKYLSVYSDGAKPTFDEENIFTTIIPLQKENIRITPGGIHEGLSEGIHEGLNEGLREGLNEGLIKEISDDVRKNLNDLLLFVYQNEGVQTGDIAEHLTVSVKTAERYISILKKLEIIEYTGAKKTGGYYMSGSFKKMIE
jgi:ATP-dependent DNA helicase RecG